MDGSLRQLFRQKMPAVHWVSIESGFTDLGIPDMNGCYLGTEFWVEGKAARGWQVRVRPGQVAWISRRCRAGGRAFVAVRRAEAELWLVPGRDVVELVESGLRGKEDRWRRWLGGPAQWRWGDVLWVLSQERFT